MHEFDEEVEEKEIKLSTGFDSQQRHIARTVRALHRNLGPRNREAVIKRLKYVYEEYELEVLGNYMCRRAIYEEYNRRIHNKPHRLAVNSMSRRFVKGQRSDATFKRISARNLEREVTKAITEAFNADKMGRYQDAADSLAKVEFHHDILFGTWRTGSKTRDIMNGKSMIDVLKADKATKAINLANQIDKLQDRLFRSTIKMAALLTKKAAATLSGDVVTEEELLQEAIIASKIASVRYHPDFPSSFTSLAFMSIKGTLSKYVNEKTRNVVISRRQIDAMRAVRRAADRVGVSDLVLLAYTATLILKGEVTEADKANVSKKSKTPLKDLEKTKAFTEESVLLLLNNMQSESSITAVVGIDDSGHAITLGDSLPSDDPEVGEQMDNKAAYANIFKVLAKHCHSDDEALVIRLRWHSENAPVGFLTVTRLYRQETSRPIHKGKVAELENAVFARAKADPAMQELQALFI